MEYPGITWSVYYKDGSIISQWDKREGDNKERPYRTIKWPEVDMIAFENSWFTFKTHLPEIADILQWSLRSRHFKDLLGRDSMAFMLIQSLKDQPIEEKTVKDVLYIFPNGVTHSCHKFSCSSVYDYGRNLLKNSLKGIIPLHEIMDLSIDAILT